jgi:hypothetical protein
VSGDVTVFCDNADNFDALVAYDEKLLDNWVDEGGCTPDSMVLTSTTKAFMAIATGFVGLGRIGNVVLIEGGAGALVGCCARLLRVVQAGNTCVPVSQQHALRLSRQRFLVTLDELASKAGLNMRAIAQGGIQGGQWLLVPDLPQAGVIAARSLPPAGAALV